ncbi:hypothetical protein NA57DRAFT_44686 [Rhizodiscina lignyota]|uniref:Uncharacterized protein n=1 Tax=Rhizodiscina lignyota TaxID=1504668 RepID=A0A9P4IAL1_9PEZI|nr:hypothetical protein NA57DRAFT_44686 [Rhizodiscina lignyota]
MHDHASEGTKIEWSDDDDDIDTVANSKKTRTVAKGKRPAPVKKQKTAPSVVGKHSDSDQLPDEVLPDYVKTRKTKFEKIQKKLGEAGLKLPPRYDDIEFSDDERLGDLQERPVLPHLKPCTPYEDITLQYSAGLIPASIAQWLRDYQVEGVAFLHESFVYQRGCILGDDMGLGKTIQVIGFLTAAFGKTGDERDRKRMRKVRRASDDQWYPRVLIICPGTLMANWQSELRRWGWWHIYVFHGDPNSKADALKAAANGRVEIMITTYATYRNHASEINLIDWDCVIADECHQIKGWRAETTRAMNGINALCRIGLTGTAIQNNYEELWTLLNWANPGRFGSVGSWKQCISNPLKMGQAHDCTMEQLGVARKTAKKLVDHLLPRFFLRRMKTLIADQLPKKSDRIVFCPLTEIQTEAYLRILDGEAIEAIITSTDMCPCASGKKRGWCCGAQLEDGSSWKALVFPCIVTLQKIANHVALLIPRSEDLQEKQTKDLENLQLALPNEWTNLYRQKDSIMHFANEELCGKWKPLRKLLRYWYDNPSNSVPNKVLIFSHSVRLLRMLELLLKSTTSYNVSYLDGNVPLNDRSQIVDDFNADPNQFIFLISTRAGGVGLNITSANKVVVVDPNWNPSYDLQAQDRAYRIGQTRDVEVFRLISAGTIEEIVYARQIYKQQQANIGYNASLERRYFRGVQDESQKKGEIFGLKNMFSYQPDNVVLREIVNKTNIAESRAGVLVADIDMSQDDPEGDQDDIIRGDDNDENAAMVKLTAIITGEDDNQKSKKRAKAKSKTDAVQAILAGAGVSYTHENSEVIGTSKIESKLSRAAVERTGDVETIGEKIFSDSQQAPFYAPAPPSDGPDGLRNVSWKYNPPEDVKRRQFCSMAKHFGFENVTEFALVVEGWTQAQRRDCLEKFHRARKELLFPFEKKDAGDGDSSESL